MREPPASGPQEHDVNPSRPLPGRLLGHRQWRRHTLAAAMLATAMVTGLWLLQAPAGSLAAAALLLYGIVIWRALRDLDMMRDLRSQGRKGH